MIEVTVVKEHCDTTISGPTKIIIAEAGVMLAGVLTAIFDDMGVTADVEERLYRIITENVANSIKHRKEGETDARL